MPFVFVTQEAFTGGEITPSSRSRVSLDKYPISCALIKNWVVEPHGGISTRGGYEYVGPLLDHSKKGRLIPFQFSVDQAYMLLFEEESVRFFVDGAAVLIGKSPTVWSDIDWAVGDYVSYSGDNFYCLKAVTASAPAPTAGSAYWQLITDDVLQLKTPFQEEDLALIKKEQDADVIWLAHPSYMTRVLTRFGVDEWGLREMTEGTSVTKPSVTVGAGLAFRVAAIDEFGEESLTSDILRGNPGGTLQWQALPGFTYKVYKLTNGTEIFSADVNPDVSTPTTFTYNISDPIETDSSKPYGIHSDTTIFDAVDKYPGVLAYFQQRLVKARTNNQPHYIWGSRVGFPENHNRSFVLTASDGYVYPLNARQLNEIKWMVVLDELLVGTAGAIWSISGGRFDVVTPVEPPVMIVQSDIGVSDIQPLVVGKAVLFLEGSNRVVRDLSYFIDDGGYDGQDVSILAEHLFRDSPMASWCYQRSPDSTAWGAREDGIGVGLTYYKDHKIWAWHQNNTGRNVNGVFTPDVIEDIESIRTNAGADDVYRIVQRDINGGSKRYLERSRDRLPTTDVEDAFAVDCGLTYTGAAATTLSGLGHLEGETVVALANGNVVKDLEVFAGEVELPDAATKAHVGLGYTCDIESLDLQALTRQGSLLGRKRDVVEIDVSLRDTRQLLVGPDFSNLFPIKFRSTEPLGDPIGLYNGDKEKSLAKPSNAGRSAKVVFRVADPVPATILSFTAKVEYGDG